MELDHIGLAGDPQFQGPDRERPGDANTGSGFEVVSVGALVQSCAFDGQPVFGPESFDVDQRALSLAKNQVLQRRDRQQLIFGKHDCPT